MDVFRRSSQLDISTARKFLGAVPHRRAAGEPRDQDPFEKSEPFLRLSQEQKKLGWEDKLEKIPEAGGHSGGGSKPTDPAVGMILPMIREDQYGDGKGNSPPQRPVPHLLCAGTGSLPPAAD